MGFLKIRLCEVHFFSDNGSRTMHDYNSQSS